ncbi:MAG: ankyrin repeat domain-containing protein, partial [Deltaproteobacteria bacterium]|nr:ankyrin repeat domain-containing protein [Deltaproteobacteria bacterium]
MGLFGSLFGNGGKDLGAELIEAAKAGDIEKAKHLLAKGADVNARRNDGATALMMASLQGHAEVVKGLLAKRADVNARRNDG